MKVIGIGVILQTQSNTYLFQERDHNTSVNPGRIAPFGGGLEGNESVYECAQREILEELELRLEARDLKDIGLFSGWRGPELFIQMFIAKDIDPSYLRLQEGKSIVELTKEEVFQNELVTDFAKDVLRSL